MIDNLNLLRILPPRSFLSTPIIPYRKVKVVGKSTPFTLKNGGYPPLMCMLNYQPPEAPPPPDRPPPNPLPNPPLLLLLELLELDDILLALR